VTTAGLAAKLEVSEAALYRHFASKAQMFEGLIEFIEQSVFTLVNQIVEKEADARVQVHKVLAVLLQFGEKNPGMTRVMVGDALVFENDRLTARMNQFFERIESQLRQSLRQLAEAEALRNLALGHSFEISGATIRSIISARRMREDFFWPAMPESAWGIMLELFAARLAGERLTVAGLAAASDTERDAALHWVDWLTGRGIASCETTAPDAMDAIVGLTETGADQMRAYLIAALRLSPWVQ